MYKLEFTLKQHTPLIHFQHDQAGATLRATEVKPKLDFFIMKKLLNDPNIPDYKVRDTFYEKAMTKLPDGKDNPWKNWLVGKGKNEHVALDYKLKITPNFNQEIRISGSNSPMYFGNMGENIKHYKLADKVPVELICFDLGLKEEVAKNISEFFFLNNFGTRQNKGYGCFEVVECKDENYQVYSPLKYPFLLITNTDYIYVLKIIEHYYKRLKAGINENFDGNCSKPYEKSFLFKYFQSKTNKGWEKRLIKEEFFSIYKDRIDKYFIRALLGLPGSFTYKRTVEPCHKRNDKRIASSYKIADDFEIEVVPPGNIERYQSPIVFVPIISGTETKVYVVSLESTIQQHDLTYILKKKFIYKEIFINDRNQVLIKSKIYKVSNQTFVDRIIAQMQIQETNIDDYISEVENLTDLKIKRKLLKQINNFIVGQKERFDTYISECNVQDHRISPPEVEISIPPSNLFNFKVSELIDSYNRNELNNSISFRVDNYSNPTIYSATIQNNTQSL